MRKIFSLILCFWVVGGGYEVAVSSGSGVISGRALIGDGTGVLSDARIFIYNVNGDAVDSAYTAQDGWFSIEVDAGEYFASAEKDSFVREFYPGAYRISEACAINVFPGQDIFVSFSLGRGGWLGGSFDFSGDAVDKALVTALKIDQPEAGWYRSVVVSGPFPVNYVLKGLLPGTYKVIGRATAKRSVFFPGTEDIEDATPIYVYQNSGVPDISFFLEPVGYGMVTGLAYDLVTGEGLSDVPIYAYQWRNFWEDPNLFTTNTLEDGSYLVQVPEGDYFVALKCDDCYAGSGQVILYYDNQYDPMKADIVAVAHGDSLTGLDFAIDLANPNTLSITGWIIDYSTGQGLGDVVVTVIDYFSGEAVNSSYSSSNGDFSINNLASGEYLLMFSGSYIIPYFYRSTETWQQAEIIDLAANFDGIQSEAITQDYGNMGLSISGKVTSTSEPLAGARVYAYHFGDDRPISYAQTNAWGDYSIIKNLTPGSYTVVCDLYGYYSSTFPETIYLDLMEHPKAEDIDFNLIPVTTAIDEISRPNELMTVSANYPNPFNGQTRIPVYSGYNADRTVRLVVYNLLGQLVGEKAATIRPGINYLDWGNDDFNGDIPSGVYFYKIDGSDSSYRMILLK